MLRASVLAIAALIAVAVAPATSRADRPTSATMTAVADVAAACAALRDALPADVACSRVGQAKLKGVGAAEVYAIKTDALVRYAMVVTAGGKTWRSPVRALPLAVCADGDCERVTKQAPKVRVVKLAGMAAAALELTVAYAYTPKGGKETTWSQYQLVACGGQAAGPVCVEATVGERARSCTAKLGATGIVSSCAEALPSLAADVDVDSHAILARAAGPGPVEIKHILVAWDALEATYAGRLDARAKARTNAQAAALAQELAATLAKAPERIDALMREHSEDPGSKEGNAYSVEANGGFVAEFTALALRLDVGEVGVVRTRYGYHVMLRVPPAPPDPLESTAILARPPGTGAVKVKHVLLSWADLSNGDPRGMKRSRTQLEALVVKLKAQLAKGGAIEPLMQQYSEDPGTADSGDSYEVDADAPMVKPFKDLALRLKVGEVGVVKTQFGIHIVKRVP
ncbi:MAG: peptidylprolyl isomerase [Myxococcales bacterium]|nr:peptidylprolyl isomerase [Myxococcales bacterium]